MSSQSTTDPITRCRSVEMSCGHHKVTAYMTEAEFNRVYNSPFGTYCILCRRNKLTVHYEVINDGSCEDSDY